MHAESLPRTTSYPRPAILGIVALAIAILLSGGFLATASAQDATPVVEGTPAAFGCDGLAPGVGAEPWIRTELSFGTTLPDGSEMTDEQWGDFLDAEITPRFPDGLTVLEGSASSSTVRASSPAKPASC